MKAFWHDHHLKSAFFDVLTLKLMWERLSWSPREELRSNAQYLEPMPATHPGKQLLGYRKARRKNNKRARMARRKNR